MDVAHVLIVKEANVNAKDSPNWTPLHLVVYDRYEAIVMLLIGKGADVNAKDRSPRLIFGRS